MSTLLQPLRRTPTVPSTTQPFMGDIIWSLRILVALESTPLVTVVVLMVFRKKTDGIDLPCFPPPDEELPTAQSVGICSERLKLLSDGPGAGVGAWDCEQMVFRGQPERDRDGPSPLRI